MRLQFPLKQIKISPSCHIQLNRHAEQQLKSKYAIGQLYGALYDDVAHVTNIMPYPDAQNMPQPSQLQSMENRHREMVTKFNMDTNNIGWYLISYKESMWEQLEIMKYYQKYINTSFVLVYDYEARLIGTNPYQAYRLADWFATKQAFNTKDFNKDQVQSPLIKMPASVQKNQLFQLFMLANQSQSLKNFTKIRLAEQQKSKIKQDKLQSIIQSFMTTLQQQSQLNRKEQERINSQGKQVKKQGVSLKFNQYCDQIGLLMKAQQQEKKLRDYETNIKLTKQFFKNVDKN